MSLFKKDLTKVLLISVVTYAVFFLPLLNADTIIYSGKDSVDLHYQSRIYLYENLRSGRFPFWTEKILMGYPIHADLERGFLNPFNVILVYTFGPYDSYKILHFLTYLVGSLSLFYLLKKFGAGILGYIVGNLVFFFSFFNLYHQLHFNMILTSHLLPTLLLLSALFIEKRKFRFIILKILLVFFSFSFGSFQVLLLFLLVDLIYILIFSKGVLDKKQIMMYLFSFYFGVFTVLLPLMPGQYLIYSDSSRSQVRDFTSGSLYPAYLANLFYPYPFERSEDFFGINLNKEYFMHEFYIYVGLSVFIFSLFFYGFIKDKRSKLFISSVALIFIVMATVKSIPLIETKIGYWLFYPLSLFRYWGRSVVVLQLVMAILIGSGLSKLNSSKKHPGNYKPLIFIGIYLVVLQLFNINSEVITYIKVIGKRIIQFDPTNYLYFLIAIFTLFSIYLFRSKKRYFKYLVAILISIDLTGFWYLANTDIFTNKAEIGLKRIDHGGFGNSRLVDLTQNISSNNYLVQNYWSPFGYSVLHPHTTKNLLQKIGFESVRYQHTGLDPLELKDSLKDIGVRYIVDITGNIEDIGGKIVEVDYDNISESEEEVIFSSDLNPGRVDTNIRFHYGWTALVNGDEIPVYKNKSGLLTFENNVYLKDADVELKYIPLPLLYGTIVSTWLIPLNYYLYLRTKGIYEKNNVKSKSK